MGGNGASDHYRNYSLDIYGGDRFKQVGTIGNNKVVSTSVYDKSGNLILFKQVKRKGKIRKEGTHTHNWSGNKEKGKVGRKTHDKKNFFEPTKSDLKFIKKALKYNQEHQK